jgi:Fe-S-cluster-containing dehydrogenase component/DMSO reductase anchor subunit
MSTAAVMPRSAIDEILVDEPKQPVRLPLLDAYLDQQPDLSAIERFARRHDAGELPHDARSYDELIPLSKPQSGEQYAFRVDLDVCTGCKACVSACHSLNGLDEGESWRSVGLLHGGTPAVPVVQTVTTACHHCVDPACLSGCPVQAYDKDPVTGIVRHLDDQCIGCQYCILTCPYEVPRYNADKGIVRKCDMCSGRLAEGEAPACVQACPNEAISIQIVSQRDAVEDAQADAFLPGAPSPGITVPTTSYSTERALPRNLLPADFYSVRPAHQHMPLVFMLVLTQLAVGAFGVGWLVQRFGGPAIAAFELHQAVAALSVGLVALGASVLHLGRPQFAHRAVLGLRTSWLSREVVAFGAFSSSAMLYAAFLWPSRWSPANLLDESSRSDATSALGAAVVATGIVGVACSAMVYHATRRRWWRIGRTGFKFTMTAVVLGLAMTLCAAAGARLTVEADTALSALVRIVAWLLVGASTLKLVHEASVFRHLRAKQHTDLKRSALLLRGELRKQTQARFMLGVFGGIVVPLVVAATAPQSTVAAVVGAALALVLCTLGELLERAAFFTAMAAPRMPGAMP